jgi:hypothetical protein
MTGHPAHRDDLARSPFAGQHVHELLHLDVDPAGPQPRFDDDCWDLRAVRNAPIEVAPYLLVWDFTEIPQPHWRLLLREFLVALRSPHHERIAHLPWARREPLSLSTCGQRRYDALAWLRWLAGEGVEHFGQLTQQHCDRWLHDLRSSRTSASSVYNQVLMVKDLARYTDMFTGDLELSRS